MTQDGRSEEVHWRSVVFIRHPEDEKDRQEALEERLHRGDGLPREAFSDEEDFEGESASSAHFEEEFPFVRVGCHCAGQNPKTGSLFVYLLYLLDRL